MRRKGKANDGRRRELATVINLDDYRIPREDDVEDVKPEDGPTEDGGVILCW